jgi:hypothetical protein
MPTLIGGGEVTTTTIFDNSEEGGTFTETLLSPQIQTGNRMRVRSSKFANSLMRKDLPTVQEDNNLKTEIQAAFLDSLQIKTRPITSKSRL